MNILFCDGFKKFIVENPKFSFEILDLIEAYERMRSICLAIIDRAQDDSIIFKNFKHKLDAKEKAFLENIKNNDIKKFFTDAEWSDEDLVIINIIMDME